MKKVIFIFFSLVFIKCSAPSEKIQDPKHTEGDTAVITSIKDSIEQKTESVFSLPEGFEILDSLSGNLNLDTCPDAIVLLKVKGEDTLYDVCRPLLIFLGDPNGKMKLAARNDSVVLCRSCGGVFGDPYESSVIKDGYFSIQHYGGSNWRWTRIITFKYNKEKNTFVLHRDAGESYHTMDPEKTEAIVSNKKAYGVLPFKKFSNARGF